MKNQSIQKKTKLNKIICKVYQQAGCEIVEETSPQNLANPANIDLAGPSQFPNKTPYCLNNNLENVNYGLQTRNVLQPANLELLRGENNKQAPLKLEDVKPPALSLKEQLEHHESNSQANATRTQARLEAQLLRTRPISVNFSGFENFNHSSLPSEDLVTLNQLIARENQVNNDHQRVIYEHQQLLVLQRQQQYQQQQFIQKISELQKLENELSLQSTQLQKEKDELNQKRDKYRKDNQNYDEKITQMHTDFKNLEEQKKILQEKQIQLNELEKNLFELEKKLQTEIKFKSNQLRNLLQNGSLLNKVLMRKKNSRIFRVPVGQLANLQVLRNNVIARFATFVSGSGITFLGTRLFPLNMIGTSAVTVLGGLFSGLSIIRSQNQMAYLQIIEIGELLLRFLNLIQYEPEAVEDFIQHAGLVELNTYYRLIDLNKQLTRILSQNEHYLKDENPPYFDVYRQILNILSQLSTDPKEDHLTIQECGKFQILYNQYKIKQFI